MRLRSSRQSELRAQVRAVNAAPIKHSATGASQARPARRPMAYRARTTQHSQRHGRQVEEAFRHDRANGKEQVGGGQECCKRQAGNEVYGTVEPEHQQRRGGHRGYHGPRQPVLQATVASGICA